MKRRVNWKILAGLALGLLLLAGGGYGVYAWRARRTADTLLAQANRAEEEGRYRDAAGVLAYYLAYVPGDNGQRLRMGRLLEQAGTPETRGQAIDVFARVLRAEPHRDDLRRRLVDLAMELERFDQARPHLTHLLRASPDEAELEYRLGRCAEAAREEEAAAEWYDKARRHAPHQVDSHARLAHLLRRRLDQAARADEVADEMVAANKDSFRAHLARARYRRLYGKPEAWAEDVCRARELAPDEPEVLQAAAELCQARNDLGGARDLLRRSVQQAPKNAALHRALAGVELQAGRPREAVACLRQGLTQVADPDELLEAFAEALVEAGQLEEAGSVIGRLREKKFPKSGLDYLEARVLMGKEQWEEAARVLEAVRPKLPAASERAGRAERALGQCHERLGNPARALEAYQKAVGHDARGVASRVALAAALLAAGRTDEAVAECRAVAALPGAPGGGLTLLARGLLLQNLRLPPRERSGGATGGATGGAIWREVDEVLARAARENPASAEVVVLRAEALAGRGAADKALALLEEANARQPGEVAFWVALIAFQEQRGRPEDTLALLERARQQLGDRAELVLARVRHWAAQPGAEAAEMLAQVERDLEKLPAGHQPRVIAALAEARYLRGDYQEAGRLWGLAAERRPNDLAPRIHLLDLALRAESEEALRRQVEALRRIEGEEGTFWRFGEATRMLLRARGGDREALDRAGVLRDELARRRPGWGRTALLAASLDELKGDGAGAVENYRRALERGENQVAIVRRLVQLLTAQQRYAEAAEVLRGLKQEQWTGGEFLRLAAEVSLHTREKARALELAAKAVSPTSTDYRDHLWLGQLLAAARQMEEAETALRRAADLGGPEPAPWVALVECLAGQGLNEKAEAALRSAQEKIAPDRAGAALARCHEALGQRDRAEEQHAADLKTRPDDPAALHDAAAFHLRGAALRKAEPLLRRLLDPRTKASAAEQAWARRSLAVLLAQTGSQKEFREALTLLGSDLGETAEDQRARALVLATRPGRRREAIRLLQAVRQRTALSAEDLFLLAQLHEREGDWPAARDVLESLSDTQGSNPQYLAHFARGLIRRGEVEEARRRVERLEKQEPATLRTVEVRARLLKATGKGEEAVALLREYARTEDALRLPLAALLEELGEPAAAEPLYREHAAAPARGGDPASRPEGVLVLAAHLGRRGRIAEALDLLDGAWKTCPPEAVAFAAVALLHQPKIEGAHYERIERALKAAAEKAPTSTLLLHLATLHSLQGRYPEAEGVYRRILERDSGNVVALNNLAWLLAHQKGKGDEALNFLRRALDAAGPLPDLLDTRAVVYLNQGQSERAIKDLEEALADRPTPATYFHLARAHLSWSRGAAEEALRKSRAAGLTPEGLHPLERDSYQAVVQELELP